MGNNSSRLRLYGLGPSHLQPFRGYVGIKGHVLGFKGRCPVAVLVKNTAQTGCRMLFPALDMVP